jgi:hypothetical protein
VRGPASTFGRRQVVVLSLPVEIRAIRTSRRSIEVPEVQARRQVDRAALSSPAHGGYADPSATVPSSSVMVLPPHGQRQDHQQVDREPDYHLHDRPPHLAADPPLPRSAEHKPAAALGGGWPRAAGSATSGCQGSPSCGSGMSLRPWDHSTPVTRAEPPTDAQQAAAV